jgi:hypothetical protein
MKIPEIIPQPIHKPILNGGNAQLSLLAVSQIQYKNGITIQTKKKSTGR